jgi:uncharacterized membrane protein
VHRDSIDLGTLTASAIGAVLGNVFVPGLGGVLGGAALGKMANRYVRESRMAKKRKGYS